MSVGNLNHIPFIVIDYQLVRMNFSHGSYEYHQSVIDNTRKMVQGRIAQHQLAYVVR